MRRQVDTRTPPPARTPLSPAVADMFMKLSSWTPATMEQAIEACNRIIRTANEDMYKSASMDTSERYDKFFAGLAGKCIKFPTGIRNSFDYMFIKGAEWDRNDFDTLVKLFGIRLGKYNRIGGDTIQASSVSIRYGNVLELSPSHIIVSDCGTRAQYAIVTDPEEYALAAMRVKALAAEAMKIPDTPERPKKPSRAPRIPRPVGAGGRPKRTRRKK